MAVAAMAWVDGIPYSAFVLFSSFTTGGDRGRGHFRMSLETWPMYITIWGQERPQGCQSAQAIPMQPTQEPPAFLCFFLQNPPLQVQNLSPELLKGFPLAQSAKEAVVLLHCVVT